jgi:hypothetical protein
MQAGLHMVGFPVVALARDYCFMWRWYGTGFPVFRFSIKFRSKYKDLNNAIRGGF